MIVSFGVPARPCLLCLAGGVLLLHLPAYSGAKRSANMSLPSLPLDSFLSLGRPGQGPSWKLTSNNPRDDEERNTGSQPPIQIMYQNEFGEGLAVRNPVVTLDSH